MVPKTKRIGENEWVSKCRRIRIFKDMGKGQHPEIWKVYVDGKYIGGNVNIIMAEERAKAYLASNPRPITSSNGTTPTEQPC